MFLRQKNQVSLFICVCQIPNIFLHKFSAKTRFDTEVFNFGYFLKQLVSTFGLEIENPCMQEQLH